MRTLSRVNTLTVSARLRDGGFYSGINKPGLIGCLKQEARVTEYPTCKIDDEAKMEETRRVNTSAKPTSLTSATVSHRKIGR